MKTPKLNQADCMLAERGKACSCLEKEGWWCVEDSDRAVRISALAECPRGLVPLAARRKYVAALAARAEIAREVTATALEPSLEGSETLPRNEAPTQVLLVIDLERPHEVLYDDVIVPVRPAEFRLLVALARKPGKCLSYDALYAEMWQEKIVEPGQIYSHTSRLRKKLTQAVPGVLAAKTVLLTVPKHGLLLNLREAAVMIMSQT